MWVYTRSRLIYQRTRGAFVWKLTGGLQRDGSGNGGESRYSVHVHRQAGVRWQWNIN